MLKTAIPIFLPVNASGEPLHVVAEVLASPEKALRPLASHASRKRLHVLCKFNPKDSYLNEEIEVTPQNKSLLDTARQEASGEQISTRIVDTKAILRQALEVMTPFRLESCLRAWSWSSFVFQQGLLVQV